MFDNEPLAPSEAVIDTSPDSTDLARSLDAWVRLKQQLIDDFFKPTWQAIQAVIARAFQQLVRAWHECFSDGKPHARRRPRNSRVQRVQAKRERLNLSQDGKYPTLRSRKASYTLAHEVERWCEQKRETRPNLRDFEHVPARRRKRKARRQLKWKPIQASEQERAWMEWIDASTCEICAAFGINEQLLGELSTRNVDNSARIVRATQESEQGNG